MRRSQSGSKCVTSPSRSDSIENQAKHEPQSLREFEILRAGGSQAVADLYSQYRPQLERMVDFRMDRRLLGRVDAADILQDSYIEIARRVDSFLKDPQVSFFVWTRQITWQTLMMTHRSHLGAKKRDVRQEVRWHGNGFGDGTSVSLASRLVGDVTSPSQGVIRDEQATRLRTALESMDSIDREVLALRHFEQLSNKEVAEVLNLGKTAASNRYVRALERLKIIMDETLGTNQ